jgi:hypothetical protein
VDAITGIVIRADTRYFVRMSVTCAKPECVNRPDVITSDVLELIITPFPLSRGGREQSVYRLATGQTAVGSGFEYRYRQQLSLLYIASSTQEEWCLQDCYALWLL